MRYRHVFPAALLLLTGLIFSAAAAERIFAAGRTEIAVLEYVDGVWRKSASFPAARPMYLVRGRALYSALAEGVVQEWKETKDKGLVPGRRMSSGGRTCCHLSLSGSGRTLYGANYSGGNIFALRLPEELHLILHTGGRKGSRRQEAPHPHYAAPSPDGTLLAVCDLGLDKVFLYPLKDEIPQSIGCMEIALPPGAGPRHLLFSPSGKTLYVGNELNSTLCVFQQQQEGAWKLVQTLPASQCANGRRNCPGALRFSENGRFLLLTNRGADTVTVFTMGQKECLIGCGEFSASAYPSDLLQKNDMLFIACLKGNCVEVRHFDPGSGRIGKLLGTLPLKGALALCP